jgi:hypothetical protein
MRINPNVLAAELERKLSEGTIQQEDLDKAVCLVHIRGSRMEDRLTYVAVKQAIQALNNEE